MFASMLMFFEVMNPRQLWDAHWESVATLALARDQGKGVASVRAYK